MNPKIIVVGANVSLKPYLKSSEESDNFEAQLERLGFEVSEEPPKRKIGFIAARDRARGSSQ